MDRRELGKRLYEAAYLTGTFKLRSGQISNFYFDKYLFESDPKLLAPIVEHLTELIPVETEILAGLDLGGIPIATGLSLHTGKPAVFVRKKAKDYGTSKLAEGIAIDGRELLIVEDVVTTGGQIIESANELRALGAGAKTVICVVQRDPAATEKLRAAGLELRPLFTLAELEELKG
jgi:orotate phosphoribosyltransferase